jgi:hypothetical protein
LTGGHDKSRAAVANAMERALVKAREIAEGK